MKIMNKKMLFAVLLIASMFLFGIQELQAATSSSTASTTTSSGGIIKCGRSGSMCTLCDIIKGFNDIIKYIMKIAVGVALLALAIGGVMYVVSAGESAAMETAKTTIKNAATGFVIIFAAYLIINTAITLLGTNSTLGMKTTTTWGQFDCTATNK